MTFGSVSELAWQDEGTLLAMAITVDGGVGNGVQLLDTATGTLRVLDSSASTYSGLAWRKDSAALAVLRSSRRRGARRSDATWRWCGPISRRHPTRRRARSIRQSPVSCRRTFASCASARRAGPKTARSCSSASRPGWPRRRALSRDGQPRRIVATSDEPDELPDVQVWHPTRPGRHGAAEARRAPRPRALDAGGVARQRRAAGAHRHSLAEEATPIPRSARALVVDTNPFAMERSIGRVLRQRLDGRSADRRQDRTSAIASKIGMCRRVRAAATLLYLKNDHTGPWICQTGKQTNITSGINTSFVDRESDATVDQKPAFGVAGWSRERPDRAALRPARHLGGRSRTDRARRV